jgi:hypothetical protein
MNITTKRNIIAGAAAMPLLPAAALAVPVTLPLLQVVAYATPADPALAAFRRWHPAFMAYITAANRPDDCPIVDVAEEAHDAAMFPLFDAIATTPAGLAGQLRLAFYTFGDVRLGGDWDNPNDYQFGADGWGKAERLMCSMLTGAERMAKEVSS